MQRLKYNYILTNQLPFRTNFQQRTGGKWLIHDTKHRRDNQLQMINGRKYDICKREGCKCGFGPKSYHI